MNMKVEAISTPSQNKPLLSPMHVIEGVDESIRTQDTSPTSEVVESSEVGESVEQRLVAQLPSTVQPIVREVVKLQSKLDNVVDPNTANAIRSGVNLLASLGLVFADLNSKSKQKDVS